MLADVILRHTAESLVRSTCSRLEEILKSILWFEVSPKTSLSKPEYTTFARRINLFLHKVRKAWVILADHSDDNLAMHCASAAKHNLSAIKKISHLQTDSAADLHFRKARSKCHFSVVQERALLLSELLEDQGMQLSPIWTFILVFTGGMIIPLSVLHILEMTRNNQKWEYIKICPSLPYNIKERLPEKKRRRRKNTEK